MIKYFSGPKIKPNCSEDPRHAFRSLYPVTQTQKSKSKVQSRNDIWTKRGQRLKHTFVLRS